VGGVVVVTVCVSLRQVGGGRVAREGCGHFLLSKIYPRVSHSCRQHSMQLMLQYFCSVSARLCSLGCHKRAIMPIMDASL
jgi:hypothetical protein